MTTNTVAHTDHAMPDPQTTTAVFREAMRKLAASVSIVTTRDAEGQPHGMVASAVIPVSMDPPSMLVAINRNASIYPVLLKSGRFCVNLLSDHQHALLTPFSQSALKEQRFRSEDWCDAWSPPPAPLPWLQHATSVIDCIVDTAIDYGTHTLFIGRVATARCERTTHAGAAPLVWLEGQRAALIPAS